jgi:peptide/nickel transport system permease protein
MVRFLKVFMREILNAVLLIVGVTTILYLIFSIMPGSFIGKGQGFSGYIDTIRRLFTFKFGISPVSGRDIGNLVFPAFKNTLILTIGSIFVSLLISVPIGILSSYRRFKSYSWTLSIFSYIISSIPVFFLGYLVLYLVSRYTGVLPIYYLNEAQRGKPILSYILPIIVLGVGNDSISEIVRLVGGELERVMSEDYVVASKARGERVLQSSVHEGIIIPIISIIFSKIPFLIGGAVIVEHVFNWPGAGRLAFQATLDRDLPVLVVIAFLSVLFVRAATLIKGMVLYYYQTSER